ncbi:MAG: hypothetical protein H0V18_12595 [Pyrinomonadaceae bacterium]|nr:hypothetical protein [Pyrinomonadaceae bacterium]
MARPAGGYKLASGERCPGVTTVLGRWKEAGGLMYWAWDQGRNGLDFRETRDKAAEAGSLTHALVELHITGKLNGDIASVIAESKATKEVGERAVMAYENYLAWERTTRLKVIRTEMSLVSERHRFGGTFDGVAVVEIDGLRSLADWKTGGIYTEALIQCAAYKGLYEEHFPLEPIDGGFHIVSFSRESGDFTHKYFSNLDEAWQQFLLLREAFEIDKRLKKRVG